MSELDKLIEILEASVKKNGSETALTLGHFLNILKKAQRDLEQEEFYDGMQAFYEDGY